MSRCGSRQSGTRHQARVEAIERGLVRANSSCQFYSGNHIQKLRSRISIHTELIDLRRAVQSFCTFPDRFILCSAKPKNCGCPILRISDTIILLINNLSDKTKLTGGNGAQRNCRPVQRLSEWGKSYFLLCLPRPCPTEILNVLWSFIIISNLLLKKSERIMKPEQNKKRFPA